MVTCLFIAMSGSGAGFSQSASASGVALLVCVKHLKATILVTDHLIVVTIYLGRVVIAVLGQVSKCKVTARQ